LKKYLLAFFVFLHYFTSYSQTPCGAFLVAISVPIQASCNAPNGSVSVSSVSGGVTPYTYSWNPSGQTTAAATGLSAGTYTLIITDNVGCSNTSTVIIAESASPINVLANVVNATCNNNSGSAFVSSLSGGTTPYTYLWNPSGQTTATATGLSAGTYTVTVTDADGCTGTTSAPLSQTPIILNVGTGFTDAICTSSTGSANLFSVSGGTTPYTYLWSPGNQTTTTITGLSAGNYTLVVTDAYGCTGTSTDLVGQSPETIGVQTGNTSTACNGSTGSVTVTNILGGTGPYTYVWNPGGQPTITATGLSAGTYTVTVTDTYGCSSSTAIAIVTATTLIPSTGATPTACNASNGSTIVTSVTGGAGPYTYSWNPGGQVTATATGLSLGTYTVNVTDANGCTGTATAIVTQTSSIITPTTTSTLVFCNTTGSASVTSVAGGNSPYTYSWNPGGQATATATGLSAGTYTVTVTDMNGCIGTASVTVTQSVSTLVPVTSSSPTSCNTNNGTASVTSVSNGTSPYTYLWNPTGQATANATGLSAGTYTITVTDVNGCVGTASTIITQTSSTLTVNTTSTPTSCNATTGTTSVSSVSGGATPYTYSWNPSGQTTITATGLSAGTYTITITDICGNSGTATAIVTQSAALTATTAATGACAGGTGTATGTANGGTNPYTYLWSPGGQTTTLVTGLTIGSYTVTVTDNNGCTASADAIISTAGFTPTVDAAASSPSICEGLSITLSATGHNITSSYTWQPGALTGPAVTVTPTVTTTYTVTGSNMCGTADTTVTINVNSLPSPAFNANVTTGCSPLCIQFYNLSTVSSGRITTSLWSFGNGDTITGQNPIYCYKNPGTYSVKITATSDSGCSATLTQQNYITVYTNPVVKFTATPQPTTILQPTIQFTDKSTDAYGIAQWYWSFGDGSDSSSQNPNTSHTYYDTGMYCPNLVVMNIYGCTDSVTNCLVIAPLYTLYIPSAFTPNGDGLNEIFQAKGNNVASFEMYIFDKWGVVLFHTTDINNGWNGIFKSRVCQEDSYIYNITVFDSEDNEHNYTGTVNLLK